jgi:hypothetical protein
MAKVFTDKSQFVELIPGELNIGLDTIQPRIDDVVDKFIVPVVSKVQMDALLLLVDANEELSEENEALLKKIRKAVAHWSMALSAADLDVTIGAGGATVKTGENIAIASGERVRKYVENRMMDAQSAMDDLIKHLDENATNYPQYASSAERAKTYKYFINTTEQLQDILVPAPGRWLLERMKPVIADVEQRYILHVLCTPLYDHLKELIKNRGGVTQTTGVDFGVYAPLVSMIERAVAHLAFSEAIDQIGLKVDVVHGVYISYYRNANEPAQSTSKAGEDLRWIREQNKERGTTALQQLKEELLKNASSYPLYESSDCYIAPEDSELYIKADDMKNKGGGFFVGIEK